MTKEIARRFAHHQGYSNHGAVQAPTFTEMTAYAMQAFTRGDIDAGTMAAMFESFRLYQDNDYWNSISPRERAFLMAEGMGYRSLLVRIESQYNRHP